MPSESYGYYFPLIKIADFRTILGTALELEHDKWDVGLVELAYPKGYKQRYLHNTLCLDSEDIIIFKALSICFRPSHKYKQILKPSANENLIRIFSNYINKYEGQIN